MANADHLALLRSTAEAWNSWREDNPEICPDLANTDLCGADLSRRTLTACDLTRADLTDATIRECSLSGAKLVAARAVRADFSWSNLEWVNAYQADLSDAILIRCLAEKVSFEDANLTRANLASARFSSAVLTRANLTDAYLASSEFIRSQMQGVSFAGSKQGLTVFLDVTLVGASGLDACEHHSFNIIDFRTLINSAGQLPLAFLRGCGVPEGLIQQYLAHWDEFSFVTSAFVSHSSHDRRFVDRLVDALQTLGIRCFYSRYDMKPGDPNRDTFYAQIEANDFLLCVISKHALASHWVRDEVQHAFAREREFKRRIVIPIRLDNDVMTTRLGWAITLRDDRHIEDFGDWENPLSFDRALNRLLDAIRTEPRS